MQLNDKDYHEYCGFQHPCNQSYLIQLNFVLENREQARDALIVVQSPKQILFNK